MVLREGEVRPGDLITLLPAVPVVVLEELLGIVAAVWIWNRFGLRDPSRRRALVRRGRLALVRT